MGEEGVYQNNHRNFDLRAENLQLLEITLKRRQLEILGIPEIPKERTKKMVCELFEKKLKITCNDIVVESCSRLGFGTNRTIVVNFRYLKDRDLIWSNQVHLNNTKYSIIEH